jgi:glycosyltransferase involved in cell wall biosynthesis
MSTSAISDQSPQPTEPRSGKAHALLHLIDFEEPFGYNVVEAMACGTPVIAYDRGSMAELINHATTGYLVGGPAGAAHAAARATDLDREAIRASAVRRFDVVTMVDRYVTLYRSVLAGLAENCHRE